MRRRTQVAVVVALLVTLGVAVVALAQINRSDARVAAGSVAVTRDGATLAMFTVGQLEALRAVSVERKIISSSHADEEGTFTGVPLRDLLDEVDPTLLDTAEMVVIRATDGYVSSLAVDEVDGADSVILAYAKDGETLGTSSDGGSGPFRIIIVTDTYGNRCAKWVNEIEIR